MTEFKLNTSTDFNKVKVGQKTLRDDVFLSLDYLNNKRKHTFLTRERIVKALKEKDLVTLRIASDEWYNKDGIYSRLCRYMAYLYRFDYFVAPIVFDKKIKDSKVIEGWYKACDLLDSSFLKKTFGDIALKVIKNGVFYGYSVKKKDSAYIQELPIKYCRCRYFLNGHPAIEFNIKYFNDAFPDTSYRLKVLKMFPKEFQKAYIAFQKGELPLDYNGDQRGWFLLDPSCALKFNLSNNDAPLFASVIPLLIDLDEAQDLDKERMAQQLIRVIIQKLPIDKNGDLVFDIGEAQVLHNNAVKMLENTIGVDVLTTFADVSVADMYDKGNVSSIDQLDKVERTVYNSAGVSQAQFNSDSNLALEKSIANDEATMCDLVYQFGTYLQTLLEPFNKNPRRLKYKVDILPTTIYNYQELAKLYKEQTAMGFSKLLPQVALGQSQSSIIATAYFENKLMDLNELFVPPQLSSTISAKEEENNSGRPKLDDDKKSDKTISNNETPGLG